MDWFQSFREALWFWVYDFTKIIVLLAVLFYELMDLRTYLSPPRISRTLSKQQDDKHDRDPLLRVASPGGLLRVGGRARRRQLPEGIDLTCSAGSGV